MKKNSFIPFICIALCIASIAHSCKKKAAPVVFTEGSTNIMGTKATVEGSIFSGEGISHCGICWSTSPSPTIDGDHTSEEYRQSPFTSVLTGLSPNSVYFARAYATNGDGTGYGDDITITTTGLVIGDGLGGGTIFYFLKPGETGYDPNTLHGYIAAPNNLPNSMPWDDMVTMTTGTQQGIGTGKANTATIVSKLGSGNYAAKACDDLNMSGYSDWFLPSLSELQELCIQRELVDNLSGGGLYWSSSEFTGTRAFQAYSSDGHGANADKGEKCSVRPVREF